MHARAHGSNVRHRFLVVFSNGSIVAATDRNGCMRKLPISETSKRLGTGILKKVLVPAKKENIPIEKHLLP